MANDISKRNEFMGEIDLALNETTQELISQIREDRNRSETIYLELLNLFNQGKNNPEDLRELNKAQELVQKTTDAMQKVMTTLAKVKTGDAKVQLAIMNTGDGNTNVITDRQAMLDMIEEIDNAQDKVINVEPTNEAEEYTQ